MSEARTSAGRGPRPGRRQRRMGQNFLADPNLLDLIVREAGVGEGEVVLEVGGGAGALTERLAAVSGTVHVVEADERLRPVLEASAAERQNVDLHWGDAMRLDLTALRPPPTAMVSNLPYSIATPLLLRTAAELPGLQRWLVMVQWEIAHRLAATPGSKLYGAPSAVLQMACEAEVVRKVPPEVFSPRPRVGSALLRLRRIGAGLPAAERQVIRDAFAHRRKSLARSLELTGEGRRALAIEALEEAGLDPGVRAETLTPGELAGVAGKVLAGARE